MHKTFLRTPAPEPIFLLSGMAVAMTLVAGCASYPAPTESLGATRLVLAQAQLAPHEFAPEPLARAQSKVALGDRWVAAGDYKPARWLAEQAQVDAELALMKAASARARLAATAATQALRMQAAIEPRR